MKMDFGDKVGIVACSNGISKENEGKTELLKKALMMVGLTPVFSDCIVEKEGGAAGTGEQRAKALMDFYRDDTVKAIFDISGGDLANEILPFLDFSVIADSGKQFWGYSDLTVILNAIYAKTGLPSVLYQVRNLIRDDGENQIRNFSNTVMNGGRQLYHFDYEFLQGNTLEGIVVGGNIRCFLKLAGTPFWPDMDGKVLLLEAWNGTVPQMVTYLSQLQQIGVFDRIGGILLGTFTRMEEQRCTPAMGELIRKYAGEHLPVVTTRKIGHGADSKAIVIGQEIRLERLSSEKGF
ncbi:MAG: LD-carboxypeptidase [Candidatus Choladocola sp.]|nr:LD-carboxypeptidase [Candidatus Choladocola sp.]